ncbi:MAG: Uma2 family endonuclease [Thermosynechococcaceae cyanobacterium]
MNNKSAILAPLSDDRTMTIATTRQLTLAEYLDYDDGTDNRYELARGELLLMTPPSWLHFLIADYLTTFFKQAIATRQNRWIVLQGPGQQTGENSSRLPDVAIAPLDTIESALEQSAVLTVPALLVVEIVSQSTATQDYRDKVQEYAAKGIAEYWIVDPDPFGAAKYIGSPKLPTVSVYHLVNRSYQVQRFQGSQFINSPTFPDLKLTADQLLQAKKPDQ